MNEIRERLTSLSGPGPLMGVGTWAIGGPTWATDGKPIGWGEVDDAESIRAIHAALDAGIRLIDTADVYGAGHSERLIGQAILGRRDEVILVSKFGCLYDDATRAFTGVMETADTAYVRRACEASLRRLGVDAIDVYLLHPSEFSIDDAETIRRTLEALVGEGKIRSYGWSTDDVAQARTMAPDAGCSTIEMELSLFNDAQPGLLQLCDEHDLVSLNRSALAMGLLTGKYDRASVLPADDIRGNSPAWLTWLDGGKPRPELLDRLDAVREILTSGGRTVAQGALAWIWGRSDRTVPIPGFRRVGQVVGLAGARAFGPLTPNEMAEVSRLLATEPVPA